MSALPGREEIAEILYNALAHARGWWKLRWDTENLGQEKERRVHLAGADALLVRLRPAFDEARREGAYVEASKEMPAVDALVKVAAERDALRSQVAACVAALRRLTKIAIHIAEEHLPAEDEPHFEDHGVEFNAALDQAEAALARVGTKEGT